MPSFFNRKKGKGGRNNHTTGSSAGKGVVPSAKDFSVEDRSKKADRCAPDSTSPNLPTSPRAAAATVPPSENSVIQTGQSSNLHGAPSNPQLGSRGLKAVGDIKKFEHSAATTELESCIVEGQNILLKTADPGARIASDKTKPRSEGKLPGAETRQGPARTEMQEKLSDVGSRASPPGTPNKASQQEQQWEVLSDLSLPLKSTEPESITGQNTQTQPSKDDKGDKSKSRGSLFVANASKFIPGFMKPTKVEEVEAAEISPSDILIGVMGPTGSGKSSFISKATGFQGGVGHDLKSCTNKVTTIRFSLPELVNNDIVFVDTPGFDDTNLPDTKILEMISDWLNQSYGRGIHLNGLLYFHRISDNRMAGTPLKNLRLFEKICGEGFDNVIMTTTMWDEVEPEEGDQREKELSEIYWKTLIKRGSQVRRFHHNQESAFRVIQSITEHANEAENKRIQQELDDLGNTLLIQKEVTVGGKELSDTEAGKTLFIQLQNLVEKHQKILGRIREDLREPSLSPEELQELMKEYQKVAEDLKQATEEMQTIATKKGVSIGRLQKLASTPRNFFNFLHKFNISIFRRFKI